MVLIKSCQFVCLTAIMFVSLYMFLMYKCMTNLSYFNSLCETKLFLGDFVVTFFPGSCRNFHFEVFNLNGDSLFLRGYVSLTRRCIHTQFHYTDFNLCKYSPLELREWCPAIHLPFTNYLHWRKFMKVALEIYVESNPKLHVLSE